MFRILFVDDEPDLLLKGKEILEADSRFYVDTARSGEDALSLLSTGTYDAIISGDIPRNTGGAGFLEQIRSSYGKIPRFLVTGRESDGTMIDDLSVAEFSLKKGTEPGSLFGILADLIPLVVCTTGYERSFQKGDWIYWVDSRGNLLYTSPSSRDITGFSPDDLYRDPDLIDRMVYESDRETWRTYREADTKDTSFSIAVRITRKDGKIRWIRKDCQTIPGEDGRRLGRKVSNRDITGGMCTEEEVIHQRDNFLKIFRAAPVGLLLLNTRMDITHANRIIGTTVFRDPADIIRKRAGEGLGCIHSREDPAGCGYSSSCPQCPLRNGIESVIKDGISIQNATIPLTLQVNGTPMKRWLSINAEPVEIDGDQSIIVAVDDITEKRAMEFSLRESEEKFRVLSDNTSAIILMYSNDRWTYGNPAAEVLTGYTREELLSQNFWEIIHPDVRERLKAQGQARERGENFTLFHDEVPIIRKNGEERIVDLVASSVTIGENIEVLVTAIDISERKNAEILLSQSEEKYRLIFENQTDLYCKIDMSGYITALSPSCKRLTGFDPPELIGTPVQKLLIDPEGRDGLLDFFIQQGTIQDFEFILERSGGERIPVSVNCHVIYDQGRPVGMEGAIRDITERKETEEALRSSEQRYRSLFENMLEGFAYCQVIYDESGNPVDCIYLKVNAAFEHMTHLANIEGKLASETVPGFYESYAEYFATFARVASSGRPERFEMVYLARDIWLNVSVYSPEKGYFVAVFEDISSRKRAEIALQEKENYYELLAENFKGVIWTMDRNGYLTYISPSVLEFSGYTPDEAREYFFDRMLTPESAALVKEKLAEFFETIRNDQPVGNTRLELEQYRQDGSSFWIEITCNGMYDASGNFIAVMGVSRDITDRKNDELLIKQLFNDYQTILDNVPALILYKDTSNRYVRVNRAAAETIGKPVSEIEGKTPAEIFPGMSEEYYRNDLDVLESGKSLTGLIEHLTMPSGEKRWFLTNRVPLRDTSGVISGVLLVRVDISNRKKIEDSITLANKKLNLLSGITRHDIANQLQGLFFALFIADEKNADPEVKKNIDKAQTYAHNIERQIAFTRDYQDLGIKTPVWQDVQQIISVVARAFDQDQIRIDIGISGVEIFADPLLEKVFHNLIDNARQYGEKITRISFYGAEKTDGYLIICEDDGVGIPAQHKSGIFMRQYYRHTGFGLNLSREILEITGITIRETGIPGEGARFEISVPKGGYQITG